ncbi:MAG: Ig-like domain-containing protein [Cyanobacteria bacterium J06639_1]
MVRLARQIWQAAVRVRSDRRRSLKRYAAIATFFLVSTFFLGLLRSPLPALHPSSEAFAQTGNSLSLISSDPPNEAIDVLVDRDVYLQFSQLLNGSFEELQISFDPAVDLSFATQDDFLVLQPIEQWDYSTQYAIQIPIQPSLPLTEPLTLTFSTEPQYTYERDIKTLVDTSCVACHQPAGRQRSSPLHSYSAVLQYVQPGESSSVLLDPKWTGRHARIRQTGRSLEFAYARARNISLEKITNGWSPDEIEMVRTWIVQDRAVESTTARQ